MKALVIRDLSVRLKKGPPLLRRVSLDLAAGEVRGLVGESGAGKSMIGKAVLGILPPRSRSRGARSCWKAPIFCACHPPNAAAASGPVAR
jgi:ABC-type glutathione transport system ATPase component